MDLRSSWVVRVNLVADIDSVHSAKYIWGCGHWERGQNLIKYVAIIPDVGDAVKGASRPEA